MKVDVLVKTTLMPQTDLETSNVLLGLMRITPLSDAQIRDLVSAARDAGINYFDHADIYGDVRHGCERRFGAAVTFSPAEREAVVIQSKVGIRDGFFDFSQQHIVASVDESLEALQLDYLDTLLLHRPDTLVEPDEVAAAFDELQTAGKVRHFGVSNHTPGQTELLKKHIDQPLAVNQVQLSITHAPLIAQGVAANMGGLGQSLSRDNGLLDYSRLNEITLQAWSPFQNGFSNGVFLGDRENYTELNTVIDELARDYAVPTSAIAVAWITRHPASMHVVLGTTTIARMQESALGSDIPLTRQEWYRIFTAAGHTLP